MVNANELHWLAGLLEGEGAFGVVRNAVNGRVYLYPKIQLGMNDEDVVRRVAVMFGSTCTCYPYKNHGKRKPRWMTCATNENARKWMGALQPLMGARRQQQIDKALACKLLLPRKLNREVADEIRARHAAGERNCDLAAVYKCSPQTICAVVKGRVWI